MILQANSLFLSADLENALEAANGRCYYSNGQSDYF